MAITLLDMLLQAKMVTPAQIDDALQNRVFFGGKIGTSLVELGYLREEDLARFLSRKLMVPYISPEALLNIPAETIALIPREMALKYRVIPLELQKKRLSLVMSDPADLAAIDEISFITGFVIKPLITPEFRLLQALSQYYGLTVSVRYQRIIDRINAEAAAPQPATPALSISSPVAAPEPAPVPPAAIAPPAPVTPIVQEVQETPETPVLAVPDESAEPRTITFEDETPPAPSGPPAERADAAEAASETGTAHDEGAWTEKIRHYAIGEISRRLACVEDREQIAEALLDTLSRDFGRAALFIVRGDNASGWRAYRHGEEIAGFEVVHIPFARSSVLKTVTEGKSFYLGPLGENPLNQRIIAGLGGEAPSAALVMPLVVLGRVVDILYLEGGQGDLADRLPAVQRLLTKAALAFEMLICRDKILMG